MISKSIHQLVKKFIKNDRYIECAEHINMGDCHHFALALQIKFPGSKVFADGQPYSNNLDHFSHAYLYYEGRYYDSECPEGVEDWRYLPIYVNNYFFPYQIEEMELQNINIPFMDGVKLRTGAK